MTTRVGFADTPRRESMRRRIVRGFAVLLPVWLVLGLVDSLVWLPLETAPTTPLEAVYATLDRAGSLVGVVLAPVLWAVLWGAAAVTYVVLLLPLHRRFGSIAAAVRPVTAAAIGLTLLGAMSFFQWWSAFGMGMEVSDDLPPFVGTTTRFGLVCVLGGLPVGLLGGAVWIVTARRAPAVRTGPRPGAR